MDSKSLKLKSLLPSFLRTALKKSEKNQKGSLEIEAVDFEDKNLIVMRFVYWVETKNEFLPRKISDVLESSLPAKDVERIFRANNKSEYFDRFLKYMEVGSYD